MSNPSPSTESDLLAPGPAAPASHDQPSGPARAPAGSRTPRRVQWASAVDDDKVAARLHDRDLESEAVSNHELDEAGLDVCNFSLLFTFLTHGFHSQLSSRRSLMLSSDTIARLPLRLFRQPLLLPNGQDSPHHIQLPQQTRPRQLLPNTPHLILISPARRLSNLMNVQDSLCHVYTKGKAHSLIANYAPPMSSARTPGTHSSSHSVFITGGPVPSKHDMSNKAQIKRKLLIWTLQ
jgi:hypothetical protein